MRYFIVFILAITFISPLLGCICDPIDSTNAQSWINEADFVVEGEYLTNINPNSDLNESRNLQNLGYDILFRVTSIIKGSISTDTIALIQFDNGSCTKTFEPGKRYIILGTEVSEFKCLDKNISSRKLREQEEIPPTNLPPPSSYVDEQGVMHYNCKEQDSDYWNRIAKKYVTSYVSYCTSYLANSKTGKHLSNN